MRLDNSSSPFHHFHILAVFLILLTACLINPIRSVGQTEKIGKYSTIVLKSGLQLTGKIISIDPKKGVTMDLNGRVTVVLEMEDIAEIKAGTLEAESRPFVYKGQRNSFSYKDKGYYVGGDFGLPFGLDAWGDPSLNVSFMLKAGYTFNRSFAVGIASGFDFYWWPNTIVNPVAIEIKGRFKDESFTPYYSLQGGYGLLTSTQNWTSETKGGLFLAPGIGIMSKNRASSGWNLHFGFRSQTVQGVREGNSFFGPSEIMEKIVYNRMDIRFGFFFE